MEEDIWKIKRKTHFKILKVLKVFRFQMKLMSVQSVLGPNKKVKRVEKRTQVPNTDYMYGHKKGNCMNQSMAP